MGLHHDLRVGLPVVQAEAAFAGWGTGARGGAVMEFLLAILCGWFILSIPTTFIVCAMFKRLGMSDVTHK